MQSVTLLLFMCSVAYLVLPCCIAQEVCGCKLHRVLFLHMITNALRKCIPAAQHLVAWVALPAKTGTARVKRLCEITAIRKFFTCTQCADVLLLLIHWCQPMLRLVLCGVGAMATSPSWAHHNKARWIASSCAWVMQCVRTAPLSHPRLSFAYVTAIAR